MAPSATQLLRNVLTLGVGQIVSWVGAAVMAVLLPRYLGDVNLGKLSYAFALVHLVGLIADLGTATYLTKEIARTPQLASRLTSAALVMRVPMSILAVVVVFVVSAFSDFDELTRTVVLVLSATILLESVTTVLLGALQGLHDMKTLAISSTVTKFLYSGLAAGALLIGSGPREVAGASVLSLMLGLAVVILTLRRHVSLQWNFSMPDWRLVIMGGLPFFIWQAALAVYGQIDTVLLAMMTHDSVVGWYAAAYRIVTIPAFVSTIVMTVMFPALAATAADSDRFNELSRRALQVVTLVTLPMGLGIMVLAPQIVGMLGYPESFDNSILPIALLAPHLPLAAMGTIIGTVLNARDRHRQWAVAGVAAAFLNPAVNFIAIPITDRMFNNGAVGAALVTTLTEVFLLIVATMLLPRGIFNLASTTDLLRCVAAGAVMVAVIFAGRALPIFVTIGLGAVVYTAACFAFGALSVSDIKGLGTTLLRPRVRGRVPSPIGGTL